MTSLEESVRDSPVCATRRGWVEDQLPIMQAMILPNGAVLASPNGHYNAHWVRDGLYVLTAALYVGLGDLAHQLVRAPFGIFQKHRARIQEGIRRKPGSSYEFLHARYHPAHFDEFEDEWGHNQLDTLGLFLHLAATLPGKGVAVFSHSRQYEDKILLNHITRYLETLEWWRCPDFGVWEEGPKPHASSIGAVLAGLKSMQRLDDHDLFFNETQIEKGQAALDELLPSESDERECDLAQLSLIWPFDVLNDEQAHEVLRRVEERLVREHGVIRYERDAYFNAADDRLISVHDPRTGRDLVDYRDEHRNLFPSECEGSEAQWPLGLAWLAIIHSKLAKRRVHRDEDPTDLKDKARGYLDRLAACAVSAPGTEVGYIPELYVGDRPNANTPLTWATALAIVAAVAYAEIDDRGVPYSGL